MGINFYPTRSLTSLDPFFESREWFQRFWGFLSKSLTDSRLCVFCGFSSFVSLSIIWFSKSWRSGGRFSSSDGSLRLSGRTIASGFALIVAVTNFSVVRIVSSPVVSLCSSAIASAEKGTAGMLSIECHSRFTRRIFVYFMFCLVMQIMSNFSQFLSRLNIHCGFF